MTIDDIFNAAINGDQEQLVSLLEAKELDINQNIDAGINNGLHTEFPVLFSILHHMNENGMNEGILDTLIAYGVDVDAKVKVSCDAFSRYVPFLSYIIRDWNNPRMLRYLLSRGANPNNTQEEHYMEGHRESYSLAYLAIVFRRDCSMLNLLLQYGADPNKPVRVYNHEAACQQELPLMFYALIDQQSMEKCEALFSYGADHKAEVVVGFGLMPTLPLNQYILMTYPRFNGMFTAAARSGRHNQKTPSPVSIKTFQTYQNPYSVTTRLQKPEQQPVAQTRQEEEDPMKEFRELAEKLIYFDWDRKEKYFAAVQTTKTKPGFFGKTKAQKAAEEYVDAVLNLRTLYRRKLDELDRQYTQGKQVRWWNAFNGLEYIPRQGREVLVWLPFSRFAEGPDGLSVCNLCTDSDTITGKEAQLLMKAGAVSPVYLDGLDAAETYRMAELCMWEVEDATEIYTTVTNTFSESEIRDAMKSKNESMDNHERLLNALQDRGAFTDDELHTFGQMKTSAFFDSQWNRDLTLSRYEDKLRNAKTTHTRVENQKMYHHYYRPVGILVMNQDQSVAAVLMYHERKQTEVYLMDSNKVIYESRKRGPYGDLETNRIAAIRGLKDFDIRPADVVGEKPKYLSEDEWYQFVYNCYRVNGIIQLKERIAMAYYAAGAAKRSKIGSTRFPF